MAIAAPSISTDQFDQPNLQIASVGAGNTLWYAWQNNGDSSWNTQLVNGNLSTLSPPSIAAVGGGGTVMSTMGWGVLDLYWTQSPNYGSNPPSWGLEQIPGVVPWS
jgi:hypothetical protein